MYIHTAVAQVCRGVCHLHEECIQQRNSKGQEGKGEEG